ncbi:MAG TPA: RIP metalloprotease RseP [Clostridiaceae bacterium]|nr:RIP metalloprotease RseP [Clostridiaceae bacterium]
MMGSLGGILIALILIGIMATLHELGHYLVGRKLGFKINTFQIFVGPKLVEWERNDITYKICLLPLGAAVHFDGEFIVSEEDEKDVSLNQDPRAFVNRPIWARAYVLLAGPFMNMLTGVLAMFICFALVGYRLPVVAEVSAQSQAAAAGLQADDEIIAVDGKSIHTDLDFSAALLFKPQLEQAELTVKRGDEEIDLTLVPQIEERSMLGISLTPTGDGLAKVVEVNQASNGGDPVFREGDILIAIGETPVKADNIANVLAAQMSEVVEMTVLRDGESVRLNTRLMPVQTVNPLGVQLVRSHNMLRGIPYSFSYSWSVLRTTGKGLIQLIAGQIAPQDALAGPVGIVTMISGVVTERDISVTDKVVELLQLFALISLSIGFTNLLPIPLLDGNQLLLLVVEGIRGKRLSYRTQSVISVVGVVLLLGLFGLALFVDLARLMQ